MEEKKNYVYFIESHIKEQKIKIKHSDSELELIKYQNYEDGDYLIFIYRFKIRYTWGNIIELTDKKNNKFEYSIDVGSNKRDIFVFNLKFYVIKKTFSKNIKPPSSLDLSRKEQFNFYYEILNTYLNDKTKINEKKDIIKSMINLLEDYDNDLEFSIYLSILKEAIPFSLFKDFVDIFKFNRVKDAHKLKEEEIKEISESLYIIEITYEDILKVLKMGIKKKII